MSEIKYVIATNNQNKLREISRILAPLGITAISQKEAGVNVDPEETGDTFEANALIKASEVSKASGLPAIADDSGLCITALGGRPGVYSARYAGEDATDEMKINKVLYELKNVSDRSAKFVSAICCYYSETDYFTVRGECHGVITNEPHGNGGFGYDPVFMVNGLDKTFAELSGEEKDKYSHRGNSLRLLKAELLSRMKGKNQ